MDPPTGWSANLGAAPVHFALAASPFVKTVIGVTGRSAMLDVARPASPSAQRRTAAGDLASLPIADATLDVAVL
jgi:hypothetical protein